MGAKQAPAPLTTPAGRDGASSPRCGVGGSCQHGRGAPPDALLVSWGCPVAVPWSWGTSGTRLLGFPSPASRHCWGRACPAAAAPLFPQKLDRAGVPRLDTAEMSLLNPSGSTCPADLGCWGSWGTVGALSPWLCPALSPRTQAAGAGLSHPIPSQLQPPGLPLGISPSTAVLRCPGPGGTFPAPAHGTAPQPSPGLCR